MAKPPAELSGVAEMQANLRRITQRFPERTARALYRRAEDIMTRSKRDFVPVDLGTLRSTGHVEEPDRQGTSVSVALVYGGPAAPYAVEQHENLDYKHKVGEAKYLERPLMEAVPRLAEQIAEDLRLEEM